MQFTNTKFNGAVVELTLLTEIMENNHFVLAGQWDYERVTYDYKFEILRMFIIYECKELLLKVTLAVDTLK